MTGRVFAKAAILETGDGRLLMAVVRGPRPPPTARRGRSVDERLPGVWHLKEDRFIAHGTWRWTELHVKTGGRPVYRYFYTRIHPRSFGMPGQLTPPEPPAGAPPPKTLGASHSAEIQYARTGERGPVTRQDGPDI